MEISNEPGEILWSAPEFHHYEKSVAWYWLVIAVSALIVGAALLSKNLLFAVFVVIATFLVFTWGHRAPRTIDFTLSKKGLDIGGRKFYPFDHLAGFAFIPTRENEELDELMLHTKGRLSNWVRIIVASQRREQIKNLLSQFLPELEYEESLAEHIGQLLRF